MDDVLYMRLMQLSGLIWPLLALVLLAGSILLYLAERRIHTLCLVIGYSIHLLSAIWSQVAPRMYPPEEMMKVMTVTSGIGLIGSGLVAYGLFSYGLIAYRKSRLPRFDDEAAG